MEIADDILVVNALYGLVHSLPRVPAAAVA
jgi:hypothetical protein